VRGRGMTMGWRKWGAFRAMAAILGIAGRASPHLPFGFAERLESASRTPLPGPVSGDGSLSSPPSRGGEGLQPGRVRRRLWRRRWGGESGFTLVELMIAIALLGVGLAYINKVFMGSWQLWKRSYTDLVIQKDARIAIEGMSQAVKHAKASGLSIDNATGEPWFSRISFRHVKEQDWVIWKQGTRLYRAVDGTTDFICDGVEALQFTYPAYGESRLVDIGLTLRRATYQSYFVRVQLTQRVDIHNP